MFFHRSLEECDNISPNFMTLSISLKFRVQDGVSEYRNLEQWLNYRVDKAVLLVESVGELHLIDIWIISDLTFLHILRLILFLFWLGMMVLRTLVNLGEVLLVVHTGIGLPLAYLVNVILQVRLILLDMSTERTSIVGSTMANLRMVLILTMAKNIFVTISYRAKHAHRFWVKFIRFIDLGLVIILNLSADTHVLLEVMVWDKHLTDVALDLSFILAVIDVKVECIASLIELLVAMLAPKIVMALHFWLAIK